MRSSHSKSQRSFYLSAQRNTLNLERARQVTVGRGSGATLFLYHPAPLFLIFFECERKAA